MFVDDLDAVPWKSVDRSEEGRRFSCYRLTEDANHRQGRRITATVATGTYETSSEILRRRVPWTFAGGNWP